MAEPTSPLCPAMYIFEFLFIIIFVFYCAQLPVGFGASLLLNRRKGLSLCSRSSREGFSFLLPEQKKRNKENSPSALFCLLRHFSPLNKKNSLRSNSFLFFTLRKAPPLYGKKVRPDLLLFHNIASLVGVWCFLSSLRSFFLSSRPYLYQKIKRDFR